MAAAIAALGEETEELRKRLRVMLGITGERLDFVGLEEVVTGRKRQPPPSNPLPKPSTVPPPKPSFIPFKPSIKKEPSSVLPVPPQSPLPAKPSVLPSNNDLPPTPAAVEVLPKPSLNPLVQVIGKPGAEAGKPALIPSGNDVARPVGAPLSLPKFSIGPQDKLETVPKAPGEEAKSGLQSGKVGLPPFPQLSHSFQPLKKPGTGENDSSAVKLAVNPLSIPKIGPSPKLSIPASPFTPQLCPKCKSKLNGSVCPVCSPADKPNNPSELPPKSSAFVPKPKIAAMPVPGVGQVPAAAPTKPGSGDLITKATDAKQCVCRMCGNQFRKKFSAAADYDQQFADFCSEECVIAFAISQ